MFYFCREITFIIVLMIRNNDIPMVNNLREIAKKVIPVGGEVWLYGSRARGEANDNSDWDLLLLLDKDTRTNDDFERYSVPFIDYGFSLGQVVMPHLYTKKQWKELNFSPFAKNVEHDKVVIL